LWGSSEVSVTNARTPVVGGGEAVWFICLVFAAHRSDRPPAPADKGGAQAARWLARSARLSSRANRVRWTLWGAPLPSQRPERKSRTKKPETQRAVVASGPRVGWMAARGSITRRHVPCTPGPTRSPPAPPS
jgi:hypothetical protein